jgi:hypothetical protein
MKMVWEISSKSKWYVVYVYDVQVCVCMYIYIYAYIYIYTYVYMYKYNNQQTDQWSGHDQKVFEKYEA